MADPVTVIVVSLLTAYLVVRLWRPLLTVLLVLGVALVCAGALSLLSLVR